MFNLLSNAVLYNNDEVVEITIDLSRAEKGSEPGWKISIEDHCEGISDELKEIIFNKHERNLFGGKDTGLGLEIINAIINRYESHIWIENRVDSDYRLGNKFNFILPGGGDQ